MPRMAVVAKSPKTQADLKEVAQNLYQVNFVDDEGRTEYIAGSKAQSLLEYCRTSDIPASLVTEPRLLDHKKYTIVAADPESVQILSKMAEAYNLGFIKDRTEPLQSNVAQALLDFCREKGANVTAEPVEE